MSPEQARAEEVDTRSDLFSMGVVLYEMATGRQAFSGPSVAVVYDSILNRDPAPVSGFNAAIPGDLDHAIRKALEKDRRFRYQHCSDLRADLERLRRDWLSGQSRAIEVRATPVAATPLPSPIPMVAPSGSISVPGPQTNARRAKRAFIVGLIPGVGALYNADYKLALIQVLIFGALSSLTDWVAAPLHSFFHYLTLGFYAYMPFQAFHTAKSGPKKTE
jgi:serine/threonine protein kinase